MRPSVQVRTVGPVEEPVTIEEARTQLRIGHCGDDAYIALLIQASREYAEEKTHRAFIEQTWVVQYRGWPYRRDFQLGTDSLYRTYGNNWDHEKPDFELTRPSFMGLEKVEYYDATDTLTVLDESNYIVEPLSFPAEVSLKRAFSYPILSQDRPYPVQITFRAGFGSAEDVPAKIKMAILLMVTHLFVNRVPVTNGVIAAKFPFSIEALLESITRRNA